MNIGKEHVKLNPTAKKQSSGHDPMSEGCHKLKVQRRDAFVSLATAIGMNLNEVRKKNRYKCYSDEDQLSITYKGRDYIRIPKSIVQVDHEPGKMMAGLAERTRRFWDFLTSFDEDGIRPEVLRRFEERDKTEDVVHRHQYLLEAFSHFAREVGIEIKDVDDDNDESSGNQRAMTRDALTLSREQARWEFLFIELSRKLNILIRLADSPDSPNDGEAHGTQICFRDHHDKGFEGQTVYVWYGFHKGKLGTVAQMNNGLCRVKLETTVLNSGIIVIEGQYLVA